MLVHFYKKTVNEAGEVVLGCPDKKPHADASMQEDTIEETLDMTDAVSNTEIVSFMSVGKEHKAIPPTDKDPARMKRTIVVSRSYSMYIETDRDVDTLEGLLTKYPGSYLLYDTEMKRFMIVMV